jgi:tetratricopeptide (TPR) repeat protein
MKHFNFRYRTWLLIGLFVLLVASAWPGYRLWSQYRVEQLHEACKVAAKNENWKELDTLSRNWLELDKSNSDAWLYLAMAAEGQGDEELAADCLAKLSDKDPKCVSALFERIEILLRLNRPLDAEETCKRLLRIQPYADAAYKRLIYIYALSVRRSEMVHQIRESITRGCEPPEAYVYLFTAGVLKLSNGYMVNSRWLGKDPDNETFLVAQAYFLTISSKRDITFESHPMPGVKTDLMEDYLKRFPNNTEVIAYHLKQHVDSGNIDDVSEILAKIPDTADMDARIWRAKGWIHLAKDQFQEAEAAFKQAIKLDPYDWRTRHQLATVYRRQERSADAESTAKLAALGKELEKEILKLPRADGITGKLLARLANYARQCGDEVVFRGILKRI